MKLEKEQSWNLLRTFVCITIAGTLLHGLFDLWPSILTEFVAPVNESIWEHVKIVFWPLLVGLTMLYDKGKWGGVLLSVLLCWGWRRGLWTSCAMCCLWRWDACCRTGSKCRRGGRDG